MAVGGTTWFTLLVLVTSVFFQLFIMNDRPFKDIGFDQLADAD